MVFWSPEIVCALKNVKQRRNRKRGIEVDGIARGVVKPASLLRVALAT
jgi:hypothetical protein